MLRIKAPILYLVLPLDMLLRSKFLPFLLLLGCGSLKDPPQDATAIYSNDLEFMRKHDPTIIELQSSTHPGRALVSARYQGRVMTTSSDGLRGKSYGWINRPLIASGDINQQFNPVGGEERFWLGPEGGQFSLYFAPGDSFNISNWQVPSIIDTVRYHVTSKTESEVTFQAKAQLKNYSGSVFDIAIHRSVELLSREDLEAELNVALGSEILAVGYRTANTITNAGVEPWSYEKGLISIWLLGMLTPSDATTVIVPLPEDADRSLVTTDYFGDIPSDRLDVRNGSLSFKCDGTYRSKIGLPLAIATGIAGSYDAQRQILTIIKYSVDEYGTYVNSQWKVHDDPYKGDVFNAYNDGPLIDGSQLGPFYELESSSPVFPLKPGETQTHDQVTFHFEGDFELLNNLARIFLHTDLNDYKILP
jgi:hypothetical protein